MKKIILLSLVAISFNTIVYAQKIPIDSASGNAMYKETIKIDDTKDKLYLKGKEWLANTFKSAKEVIQMDDKEAGQIIGKRNMEVSIRGNYAGHINYTIALYFKDGKYKYEIKNIYHEKPNTPSNGGDIGKDKPQCGIWGLFQNQWDEIKRDADSKILLLIADLKTNMAKTTSTDW